MSNRPLATAYARLLTDLKEALTGQFDWPSPEAAFASFVFALAEEIGPVPSIATLGWPEGERLVHAPQLAAAGYLIGGGHGDALRATWLQGVDRLSQRDAFPSDRQSFAHRPVELFGLAVGLAGCGKEAAQPSQWLGEVILKARREPQREIWTDVLELAAEIVLGTRAALPPMPLDEAKLDELALHRWVGRHVVQPAHTKDDDAVLLTRALTELVPRIDSARSAVVYQSLRNAIVESIESDVEQHWQVGRRQRDAVALVVALCRRFHTFSRQLLVRHSGNPKAKSANEKRAAGKPTPARKEKVNRPTVKIVDEYDVQDLMHALLKLHFDDVRPEEWTPSTGGKSARMDFLLKPERVVVETKMTRENLGQKEVGDELIIDMKRYRAHPECKILVCFVYDPKGYCHAPAALERDLSGEEAGFRTLVVVCPSES